ncbi:MAG: alpha/beta hydrolase [Lentisphaeraceae bacterium]|nr:alpha/beta hydrolase [Lentisphaeraceae bacterium]
MSPSSQFINCSWGKIHYKELNPEKPETILCLHGWLDNWASFLPLSLELSEFRLIIFDLPGHGTSDHIPDGNWYHFVDYVVRLKEIVRILELKNFHLIGHSMGAGIASLFSATFPEMIKSLTMIDGLGPLVNPPEEARDILRESILKHEGKSFRKRVFDNPELAVKARLSAGNLEYSSAKTLVENQIKESAEGWHWTYDYKLKYTSSLRLSPGQLESFLTRITCPALLITATEGYIKNSPYWDKRALIEKLIVKELSGGHHLHMDSPKDTAFCILQFLKEISS